MKKITRYLHIYHPFFTGGNHFIMTQQRLYTSAEYANHIAARVKDNKPSKISELLSDNCYDVTWIHGLESQPEPIIPDGHIVRYVNIQDSNHIQPLEYSVMQTGMYDTADQARFQAERILRDPYNENLYSGIAVPVIFAHSLGDFKTFPENSRFNFSAIHREELLEITLS